MGIEETPAKMQHKVLLIEDNPGDARLIREMIAEDPRAPFTVHFADRLAKGLEHLSAGEIALIIDEPTYSAIAFAPNTANGHDHLR